MCAVHGVSTASNVLTQDADRCVVLLLLQHCEHVLVDVCNSQFQRFQTSNFSNKIEGDWPEIRVGFTKVCCR